MAAKQDAMRESSRVPSALARSEPPAPHARRRDIADLCRTTLQRNWREGERNGVPFAYTAPSSGRYPWQWYWDSCFTAIAWRRFNPDRARAELQTLLAAATEEGFIG